MNILIVLSSAMFAQVALLLPVFLSVVAGSVLPSTADASADISADVSADAALLHRSLDARAVAPTLDFNDSTWIWTGEPTAHLGVRPFRKRIPSSNRKCPTCATILLSSDDLYTINVNGAEIGSGEGWRTSVVYTVGLNPEGDNVFAIAVNNTIGLAGPLIATILVDYTDGTTETIVTDTTWKTLQTVPPSGWTSPSFDDSRWTAAVAKLPGTQTPWGTPFVLPSAINMTDAHWIWTNETDSNGHDPVGHRAFRDTITSPYGKAAVCGKVVIGADNNYTLFVNGNNIGHGGNWHSMEAYSIPNLDPDVNVFAVDGENAPPVSPAGVIAGILIAYNDGSSETFYTDKTWKTVTGLPDGFEEVGLDDSAWSDASEYGTFLNAHWKNVTVPLA
ncbi:lectin [Desarmillaria tabescens]|uniref:Lectin n=1 Tax=Armillaria tabescens TaxID=1929756 RepID=A0AA39N792_ARMTA|nr:lectin [Desarmillaria tabescens]KAK0460128.1 lectin [Desarmillaria tabescens]